MLNSDVNIRDINYNEIDFVKEFPPADWNADLPSSIKFHFGKKYFTTIVAEKQQRIVGVANGINNNNAAWLGNIIVVPEFWRQGIGTKLTQTLIECYNDRDVPGILLIATEAGEKVYKKLGFQISSEYIFYKGGPVPEKDFKGEIVKINSHSIQDVLEMDWRITGELRSNLLMQYIDKSFLYLNTSGKLEGYHIPTFGNGFIGAETEYAGLTLLAQKLNRPENTLVIPQSNETALLFLKENGYEEFKRVPRMFLGEHVAWRPECIYSRASGDCG